jgi:hypothetical protein
MTTLPVVLNTYVLVVAIQSRLGASFAVLSSLVEVEPTIHTVVPVPLVLEYEDAML